MGDLSDISKSLLNEATSLASKQSVSNVSTAEKYADAMN